MTTELEQLARMVGGANLEPIDTADMLESSLRSSLGGVSADKVREMETEIRNSGAAVETPQLKRTASRVKTTMNEPESHGVTTNASMEKVLIALYGIREALVESFETCNINSRTASMISKQINSMASCIRYMGGDIEEFEPLNHVSGLSAPNFYKNAQKVVETTKQCYSLGDVENAEVLDNGKKIDIIFTGSSGDVTYRATGSIISEEWTGNEAIDYIYTPNSGKMSVKAFENGRWLDRSSSGKYKIVWELEESEPEVKDVQKTAKSQQVTNHTQNVVKDKLENTKEDLVDLSNINADENEDIGSPLR